MLDPRPICLAIVYSGCLRRSPVRWLVRMELCGDAALSLGQGQVREIRGRRCVGGRSLVRVACGVEAFPVGGTKVRVGAYSNRHGCCGGLGRFRTSAACSTWRIAMIRQDDLAEPGLSSVPTKLHRLLDKGALPLTPWTTAFRKVGGYSATRRRGAMHRSYRARPVPQFPPAPR